MNRKYKLKFTSDLISLKFNEIQLKEIKLFIFYKNQIKLQKNIIHILKNKHQ